MNKEKLISQLQAYNQQLNLLQRDVIRLEGVIMYIQSQLKELDSLNKEDLTNS